MVRSVVWSVGLGTMPLSWPNARSARVALVLLSPQRGYARAAERRCSACSQGTNTDRLPDQAKMAAITENGKEASIGWGTPIALR